jgi:heat shock protein HslJ
MIRISRLSTRLVLSVLLGFCLCSVAAMADQAGVAPEYLGGEWQLVAIDAQPFPAVTTIDLSEPGRATGRAPCNRWFTNLESDLPAFKTGQIAATKMACPDLAAEDVFFAALSAMTEVSAVAETLTLAGNGRSMEFKRATK